MAAATSSTARSNTASFAFDGLVAPLILRTYWSAASRTSSGVAVGSKLWSTLMFRHMPLTLDESPRRRLVQFGHLHTPRVAATISKMEPPMLLEDRNGEEEDWEADG